MNSEKTRLKTIKHQAEYYAAESIGAVLTRKQAASYLKLCCNKIDTLPISKIRIGRAVRFRKVDIDTWLAQEAEKAVAK